jgi:CheY-like chemotaxis protein
MITKQYCIIHLEDDPDITDRMVVLFEKEENITYEPVFDAQEAFERLEQGLPDLMLVDLMLEDDKNVQPGIEFIKKAKKLYPALKMIVLSNRGEQRYRNELKEYVEDFELKIFKPSVYKQKIIDLLST